MLKEKGMCYVFVFLNLKFLFFNRKLKFNNAINNYCIKEFYKYILNCHHLLIKSKIRRSKFSSTLFFSIKSEL